ncbi:LZTS1 protein, partial [Polypterus senegalus]
MGSVSSLITGHSLHNKHCRASEYKLKKTSQSKKASRSTEGYIKYGFSQDSANNNAKAISKHGKTEDFFYIKVSHKDRVPARNNTSKPFAGEEDNGAEKEMETGKSTPPKLVPISGQLGKGTEKGLIRPTAFKPVIPRNSNSSTSTTTESHSLSQIHENRLSPSDKSKEQKQKPSNGCGTLSDSGRNSMSSLPTHSTNSCCQVENLSSSVGPPNKFGGSVQNVSHSGNVSGSKESNIISLKVMSFSDSVQASHNPVASSSGQINMFSEVTSCIRSPISMKGSLIQQLEQKLLERETELQELQVSFEEKEADTCQIFEEKQKYCAEEMEGLKQRCSTKLRQVSQRALRAQQVMQLQVFQLQQEKKKLQDEMNQLARERDLLAVKLKSYEKEQTKLAPTLEETQWEVCQKSGEIALLKQQLKESQGDVSHKLNEIVSLKATLKETKGKMETLESKVKDLEEAIRAKSVEVEVCENELQRKKNEADLLREKVSKLEMDIRIMKHDLALAKEQQQKNHTKELGSRAAAFHQAKDSDNGGADEMETLQEEVEKLKTDLMEEKHKKQKMVATFQLERLTWNREKEKVIRYQKQLQRNYLQMHKKNQELEKILKELTAELESRADMDIELHDEEIQYEEIVATEI